MLTDGAVSGSSANGKRKETVRRQLTTVAVLHFSEDNGQIDYKDALNKTKPIYKISTFH